MVFKYKTVYNLIFAVSYLHMILVILATIFADNYSTTNNNDIMPIFNLVHLNNTNNIKYSDIVNFNIMMYLIPYLLFPYLNIVISFSIRMQFLNPKKIFKNKEIKKYIYIMFYKNFAQFMLYILFFVIMVCIIYSIKGYGLYISFWYSLNLILQIILQLLWIYLIMVYVYYKYPNQRNIRYKKYGYGVGFDIITLISALPTMIILLIIAISMGTYLIKYGEYILISSLFIYLLLNMILLFLGKNIKLNFLNPKLY